MPPSRSPATASTWRGVRSSSRARCGGSPSSPRTSMVGDDLAAQRAEVGRQRIGDSLRAAARDRPADRMRAGEEREGEGAGDRLLQAHEGVGGHPRQQRLGRRRAEASRQPGHRLQRAERVAPDRERVAQPGADAERSQQLARDQVPIGRDGTDQPTVALAVLAQAGGRGVQVAAHQRRAAVIERMGQRHRRLDPLQAVLRQRPLAEDRGGSAQRMDGRADVVDEAGQGQRRRPAATAHLGARLQHQHAAPGSGQGDGGGQAVGPGADDERVVAARVGYRYTSSA